MGIEVGGIILINIKRLSSWIWLTIISIIGVFVYAYMTISERVSPTADPEIVWSFWINYFQSMYPICVFLILFGYGAACIVARRAR